MVKKQRYAIFYGEFENATEKRQKKIWPSGAGIRPQIFSNFSAHDLNFHGRWGWSYLDKEVKISRL